MKKYGVIVLLALALAFIGFGLITKTKVSPTLEKFPLTSGETVRVFYLDIGPEHTWDIRTNGQKLVEMIPYKWRKRWGRWLFDTPNSTLAQTRSLLKTSKDLAIGLEYVKSSSSSPLLSDEICYVLSDNHGWYCCNLPGGMELEKGVGILFNTFPISSKELTLSLYNGMMAQPAAEKPIGQFTFINPSQSKGAPASSKMPEVLTASSLTIQDLKFYTGISLANLPVKRYNQFLQNMTEVLPPSINELFLGHVKAATMPEPTWSALLFRINDTITTSAKPLRNAKIQYEGPGGPGKKSILSTLYRSGENYALVFAENLPVNDGDFRFELTLYQDPEPLDSAWKAMPPIIPGNDAGSTKTLDMPTNHIEAGMTSARNIINFRASEDNSYWAIWAETTGTSEPLTISALRGGHVQKPFTSWCEVTSPVTSSTVTLSFAPTEPITFKFSGVPTRPDPSGEKK